MCYDDVFYKFTFYLLTYLQMQGAHDSGPKHTSFHSETVACFVTYYFFGEYNASHLGPLRIYIVMVMFWVKRGM